MEAWKDDTRITLNVGGQTFQTYASTLKTFPYTRLSTLSKDLEHYDPQNDEYFFDRNPLIFGYILDAYRTKRLHVPKDMCGSMVQEELSYWGVSKIYLQECCIKTFYSVDEDMHLIKSLKIGYYNRVCPLLERQRITKMKLWVFLDEPRSSKASKIWSLLMMLMILTSSVLYANKSVVETRIPLHESDAAFIRSQYNNTNYKFHNFFLCTEHVASLSADLVCNFVLTLDLILRLCTCPCKVNFFKNVINWTDILCSLGYWISLVVERNMRNISSNAILRIYFLCEIALALRVLRLFRLTRQVTTLQLFSLTIRKCKSQLAMFFGSVLIFTFLFAAMIFLAEFSETDSFPTVYTGMWWSLITMTTVGYGDTHPTTPQGYIIGGCCALAGVVVISMPIALMATTFGNLYQHQLAIERHFKGTNVCPVTTDAKVSNNGKTKTKDSSGERNNKIAAIEIMETVDKVDNNDNEKVD
ncbi:hypothetical protein CHS0354_011249 [Potamilus streckersoni]|uniref:BTB domain-containing protein n=1 Tax=Potamilus streckersoni TaxID=2493646 RepID=A0AAE0VH67_9BIVA|nr:hypothetical protein CHS0354_011249 [Potamilus streckersoni]